MSILINDLVVTIDFKRLPMGRKHVEKRKSPDRYFYRLLSKLGDSFSKLDIHPF